MFAQFLNPPLRINQITVKYYGRNLEQKRERKEKTTKEKR
jgi:hypothetical protein